MTDHQSIGLGLLGCGTVGQSFCQLIEAQRDEIERRTGLRLEVRRIAVRDTSKSREGVDSALLTDSIQEVIEADDVDIVIEAMGGVDPTHDLVLQAFAAGKPVVTANKELLALHGPELFVAADEAGVDLGLEAAVAAGLPFIRALRESLAGERITRVMGIVNGTTNYILSQMSEHGADYGEALAEAQELGFAEADPTADVGGFDAGSKAAIIATLAFREAVRAQDVFIEGIESTTAEDIAKATSLGQVIKLLAIVQRNDDGSISARVHPTLVTNEHPLASVRDSFNAVFVELSLIHI